MNPPPAPPLILASASAARRSLLSAAGLTFEVRPPSVDEAAVKAACRQRGESAEETALDLAWSKAGDICAPSALVIGSDQLLVCDGNWFDKPASLDDAAAQLRRLRGREHRLVTACVVLRDSAVLFSHVAQPRLTMRDFSEAFLSEYVAREGKALLGCVGAYRLEGQGIQLFASVDGEYGAILGLPILPLLGFLRGSGIIPS